MVMMFVGGVVLLFGGLLVLFLPEEIYGAGVFVPARTLIVVKLLTDICFNVTDIPHSMCTISGNNLKLSQVRPQSQHGI
jgi:hypothetical protein